MAESASNQNKEGHIVGGLAVCGVHQAGDEAKQTPTRFVVSCEFLRLNVTQRYSRKTPST